jgi:hypothetical protein
VFVPAFPEILSKLLLFSEPEVVSIISALDGSQVQIWCESGVSVLPQFQH